MGKLGEEVSQKIKSAIRAKLIELGINMENELPDYVMVLVANKKSQKQMEDDLQLFLGSSTTVFTTWLHSVLKKLEQVTVSSKGIKKKAEVVKVKPKRISSHESDGEKKDVKKHKSLQKIDPVQKEMSQDQRFDHKAEIVVNSRVKKEHIEPMSDEEAGDNDCLNIAVEMDTDVLSDEGENESVDKELGRTILKAKYRSRSGEDDERESSNDSKRPEYYKEKNDENKIAKETIVKEKTWNKSREVFEKKRNNEHRSSSMEDGADDFVQNSKIQSRNDKFQNPEKHRRVKEPSVQRVEEEEVKIKDAREILEQKANNAKKGNERVAMYERHHDRKEENTNEKDRRRKQLPSVSKMVVHETEKPVDVSIPSLVKVTPRPIRRSGIQANCNLILKAVADAEKSVATAKNVQRPKLKENIRRNRVSPEEFSEYIPPAKISITLPNDRVPSTKDEDKHSKDGDGAEQDEKTGEVLTELEPDPGHDVAPKESKYYYVNPAPELIYEDDEGEWQENMEPKFLVTLGKKANDTFFEENWDLEEGIDLGVTVGEDLAEDLFKDSDSKDSYQRVVYPKVPFNRNRLGPAPVVAVRPLQKDSEETEETKKETMEVDSEEPKKIVQVKVLKRCKYWPNCLVGDLCNFHHPEIMCRLFPNCKYGDQCIYVHPPCKYGERCHNLSCKYMHVWNPSVIAKAAPSTSESKSSSQQCIFYPNCTNKLCRYQHPPKKVQMCRFGLNCLSYGCQFDHNPSSLPSKDQLKWTKSQIL